MRDDLTPPGAAIDTSAWHRVRIPTPAQLARRRGFPPDRIDYPGMTRWCAERCRGRWVERPTDAGGTVFAFESREEAVAFALRWFPFKCG